MIGNPKRNYIEIRELIKIKEYYGISIRAIVHRLREMQVITPVYYQKWMVYMSKNYGAKDEPGKFKGEEKPKEMEVIVNRALSEGLISLSKAAVILDTDINDLRKGLANVK
jgi:Zn-dependent peptidase ImmA (M78 family)